MINKCTLVSITMKWILQGSWSNTNPLSFVRLILLVYMGNTSVSIEELRDSIATMDATQLLLHMMWTHFGFHASRPENRKKKANPAWLQ